MIETHPCEIQTGTNCRNVCFLLRYLGGLRGAELMRSQFPVWKGRSGQTRSPRYPGVKTNVSQVQQRKKVEMVQIGLE